MGYNGETELHNKYLKNKNELVRLLKEKEILDKKILVLKEAIEYYEDREKMFDD